MKIVSTEQERLEDVITRLDPLAWGQVAAFITEKNGRDLSLPPFKGPDGKDITLEEVFANLEATNQLLPALLRELLTA